MKKKLKNSSAKKDFDEGQSQIENRSIQREFGKCPMRFSFDEDKDGILKVRSFNPNQEWNESPAEALKSALKQLTGTEDQDVAQEIIDRAVSAMPLTHDLDHNTNIIYQSLTDAEPKDAFEARLSVQSTSLYAQGMQYLSRAEKANMMCQAEFFLKSAIKLLRLHNETIDTLARYRRKGEQKVVVQHVNVNDGGKAIVGNMIS